VAVSFIGGGNWRTREKPSTCRKSLTNIITSASDIMRESKTQTIGTPVHSSNVCSIKSRFSVGKKCFSFHIGSYVNLESIKIGLLVGVPIKCETK
jgi:hypothetical protein